MVRRHKVRHIKLKIVLFFKKYIFVKPRPFLPANSSDPFYAPRYVVDNPDRFGYLLEVPKKEEDVEENQDKENRV